MAFTKDLRLSASFHRIRRKEIVLRYWWVVLFLSICFALYYEGMQKKLLNQTELQKRLVEFEQQKVVLLQERDDLLLQINSQSDPAWIQMTLMKGLGVVPEGHLKVYFKEEK
jgi:uncharacterized membrane protein YhaH (DUF805 family)